MNQNDATPERSEIIKEGFGALEMSKKTELSISAAAEHSKALIQAKFIVAMRSPRNIDDVRCNIINACKRPGFAEKVRYAKPIGNGKIRGPSIKFADEATKLMRNIDVSKTTIYEDESIRKVSITAIDLETNVSKSEEIIIKKTVERKRPGKGRPVIEWRTNTNGEKVAIVAATDDETFVKEQALSAKARRNLELQLIPQDVIDEAIDVSIEITRNQDAKDPDAAKKKVIDAFFSGFGIRPSDLEEYLKHPVDKITPAEIDDLRQVYESLKQGEATWNDFISSANEEAATEPEQSAAHKKIVEVLSKKRSPVDAPTHEYGKPIVKQPDEPAIAHVGPGQKPKEEEPISPIDPKETKENGGTVAPLQTEFDGPGILQQKKNKETPEDRAERIAMMLGPFVDTEAMPGTYRMMISGDVRQQIKKALEKVGFQTGIKLGYGPKTVKLGMSAGDVSQWLVYLFDYRDEESGQLAYENGLLNIEVVDEKTGEFLFTKK